MRTEWLEDLLVILESKSLSEAADRRFLTQPAFSRRVKVIEDYVGVELLDRSRRPTVLHPFVRGQQDKIREILRDVNGLVNELKRKDHEINKRVVIACQHAIVSSIAPSIVTQLNDGLDISILLSSDNRDECFSSLLAKKSDLIMTYHCPTDRPSIEKNFIDELVIGHEKLIPVYSAKDLHRLEKDRANGELPVITYPGDVFLGRIMDKQVFPMIHNTYVSKKTETSLTLAALKLSVAGIGVAWVPKSITADDIEKGYLCDLSDQLPTYNFSIMATRLSGQHTEIKQAAWQMIANLI
jgi:DNA-binding transcriptional LysR family regulator